MLLLAAPNPNAANGGQETVPASQSPQQASEPSSSTSEPATEAASASAAEQPASERGGASLKIQIGLAFFAFFLFGANDAIVGVLLPSLQGYYNVDKATLGIIFISGSIGYLLAVFNTGFLAPKLGNTRILALGAASFASGGLAFGLQPPFFAIAIAPFLLGFGAAIVEAGLNSHLAKLPTKTALLNYLHAFFGLGALIGPVAASGMLWAGWGWNSIYFWLAGMTLILLPGFLWAFRADPSDAGDGAETDSEGGRNRIRQALQYRVVWLVAVFLLFYVGTELTLGNWSYSFLTEARNEDGFLAGWLVSGYWLGLTVGRVVLARLSARIGDKWLIQGGLLGTVSGVAVLWSAPNSAVAGMGLLLTGFSLSPILPTAVAFMSNLIPTRVLMSAISLLGSLSSIGKALFPWLAGNLAEGIGLAFLPHYVTVLVASMAIFWTILTLWAQRALASEPAVQEASEA